MVYKIFDYRGSTRPDFDRRRWQLSEKYLGATVLCSETNLTILSYPYIAGDHIPQHCGHIASLVKQLLVMHTEGFVFADLRLSNSIFKSDGTCRLIDFDIAGTVHHVYPSGFNRVIPDGVRDSRAVGGAPLHHLHDCFALAGLMRMFAVSVSPHIADGAVIVTAPTTPTTLVAAAAAAAEVNEQQNLTETQWTRAVELVAADALQAATDILNELGEKVKLTPLNKDLSSCFRYSGSPVKAAVADGPHTKAVVSTRAAAASVAAAAARRKPVQPSHSSSNVAAAASAVAAPSVVKVSPSAEVTPRRQLNFDENALRTPRLQPAGQTTSSASAGPRVPLRSLSGQGQAAGTPPQQKKRWHW